MKVYILTSKAYKDKHIVGVFTTLEKINEFKKRFPNEDYNEIEEWKIDDFLPNTYNELDIYFVAKEDENKFKVTKEMKGIWNSTMAGKICNNIFSRPYGYVFATDMNNAIEEFKNLLTKGESTLKSK